MTAETIDNSDLRKKILHNPTLLPQRQDEAGRMYRQARAIPGSPTQTIDGQWNALRQRMVFASQREKTAISPSHEAAIEARVEMLVICNEAIETFSAYQQMTWRELNAAWLKDRDNTVSAMAQSQAAFAASVGTAAMQAFDPWEAIKRLAARGITLTAGQGGVLAASPAGMITDGERATLKTHSAAVLAALGSSEVI